MRRVYLDHTATTPLDPRVFEAMRPYFGGTFGNASSIHRYGREARAALDEARDTIASSIGASAGELFFVGGGTEADNFALKGVVLEGGAAGGKHLVTTQIEHHAVLESAAFLQGLGCRVTSLEVDSLGTVDVEACASSVTPATSLISVMHANNEVGTVNPLPEISRIARQHGVPFHADAVQSFGKIPVDVDDLGVDLLSLSAHKIYGPKGIGALYIRKGTRVGRFMHGGGQERGRRAGTENVPLAVGFAKAVALCTEGMSEEAARLAGLKTYLRARIAAAAPASLFNGHPETSLPHLLNVSFDSKRMKIDGEALLFNMDLAGIAVTSGSACTSGSMEPSHVLLAMGRDAETAKATLRFSMGRWTTSEELDYTVDELDRIVRRIGRPVC
jgi:cysteine desulfurase